jgi:hypothetical protein
MASTFPSSRKISPSVRIAETDFSAYPVSGNTNRTALVGFAQKGPIGIPTRVGSVRELFRLFGRVNPDFESFLIYGALDYLREGSDVIIVRAGQDDEGSTDFAKKAWVDIPSGGVHAKIISGVTEATWEGTGVTLDEDHYIRIKSNNQPFVRELIVPKDVEFASLTNAVASSETSLQSILSAQLTDDDGFIVTSCGTGTAARLVFKSKINGPNSSIEIISARNSVYNSVNTGAASSFASNDVAADATSGTDITLGIGLTMGRAIKTGSVTSYNSSSTGVWNFGGYRNLRLEIVVFGSGDPLIDGQIQYVSLPADVNGDNLNGVTTAELLDWLNGIATGSPNSGNAGFVFVNSSGNIRLIAGSVSGTITSDPAATDLDIWYYTGPHAKVLVRSSSTGSEALGFNNVVAAGATPTEFEDDNACVPTSNRSAAHKVNGADLDTPYNVMRVWASTPGSEANGNTRVEVIVNPETARFSLRVTHFDNVENLNNLHKDEDAIGTDAIYYVERYVNGFSDFITVVDDVLVDDLPKAGVYTLGTTTASEGTDGIPDDPADQADLIIGTPERSSGLNALSETERINIDLVAVPGVSTSTVVSAMRRLCEDQRLDCMFVVDPPMGMTAIEVKKWHNGQHPLNAIKFDSSYGALYWPWVMIEDPYNKVEVWVPPSGSVLAVYARTDAVAFPWFAPAGLNRGRMQWVRRTEFVPYLQDRDDLYADDNCVNCITNLPNEGPTVFGQKTMQRFSSALDRVNVRRMMLYAEKTIRALARYMIFEPHDATLRQNMINMCSNVMGNIVTNRGANDYIVICDEELNTPEVIDRNELRVRVGVQPIKAAEFIFIEMTVHRTGSFEVSQLGPVITRVS